MFWARHELLEVTSLLCFLAGIHVDFIRLSAQFVNTICGEEEWQHDGQGNELMCNLIILPATRGCCPRGLLCLHHVWSSTFPKRQKKTSETKKNSPEVFAQSQITHQTSFDFSTVFFFFFKLPNSAGKMFPCGWFTRLFLFLFPDIQASILSALISSYSPAFKQCKGARILLYTTLISQQKIPSRPQGDEMKMPHIFAPLL